MKTASYTVHADAQQSVRWNRAAQGEGFKSTGAWLAVAADGLLRLRAKAGQPVPLAWSKGAFSVQLLDGRTLQLSGMVSPPFAYFRGTSYGPDRNKLRTLVHLPSGRIIATLKSSRQCRALAAELAPVLLRGELPDPAPIVERYRRESV